MKDKIYSVFPHIILILMLAASGYLMMSAPIQATPTAPFLKILAGIPFFGLTSMLLIYIWSRELLGKWWALMPAFLFGFSPIINAQGRYFTAPTAATFGFLLASYLFMKFLNSRTNKHLFWAGIGLGIALLINPSDVVLVPIFIIILLFFWFGETIRTKSSNILGFLGDFILILIVALALVYVAYFVLTLNFISPITRYLSEISTAVHSSFSVIHFNPFIKSFPKSMLPILILFVLSMLSGLKNMFAKFNGGKLTSKFAEYLGTNFAEFSFLVTAVLYSAYIIQNPASSGKFESLLPILPFVYILIASGLKNWINRNQLF